MISITTKSPYALRALVELARRGGGGPVPIGELARRRDIPVQFLEQLFAVLRRAGILRSQRGVKGGYSLRARARRGHRPRDRRAARRPARRAAPRACSPTPPRPPAQVLAGSTVADIVERETREAGATMYYI